MSKTIAYLAKRGRQYLHLSVERGISWGNKKDAFHFYSQEAAIQLACAFTDKDVISVVPCEEE